MSEPTTQSHPFDDEEQRQREADEAMLDRFLSVLSEHFDAVHIFASRMTRDNSGESACLSRGIGNWFSRRGMIEDWRVRSNAETVREVNDRD